MARLLATSGGPVSDAAVAKLRASFHGELIGPDDAAYHLARRIWNGAIDKRPGLVARASGAADVIDTVRFARDEGVLVSIRGGGHNVGGRALCDDGLVIDLSRMRAVHVDPKRRVVRVQGGATLGDLDRESHVHGLAVPSGIVSRTGIAGLALGGGVGWLMRHYGLTCDHLLSCDLVTAEGKFVTASAEENADLFWALRGGGGNFGVVVSFEFRAHPVHTVYGGMILFPRGRAREVLRAYRDLTDEAPDELTAYAVLLTVPGVGPVVGSLACWSGSLDQGERAFARLRKLGTPALDALGPIPFPRQQRLIDDSAVDGNPNYWKSSFLKRLSDDAIDLLIDSANRATSPLTVIVAEHLGGAIARVAADATAFAHRRETVDVGLLAQWTPGEDPGPHVQWTRDAAKALRPFGTGAYFLNFLDRDDDATVRAAFGANYDRLVTVKNRWDPTNFFRINQNVSPTV
jgi:FAD binding domain/Berberine and berberine like